MILYLYILLSHVIHKKILFEKYAVKTLICKWNVVLCTCNALFVRGNVGGNNLKKKCFFPFISYCKAYKHHTFENSYMKTTATRIREKKNHSPAGNNEYKEI